MSTLFVPALIGADFPSCTASEYTGYASVVYAQEQFYVFWEGQRQAPLTGVYGSVDVLVTGIAAQPQAPAAPVSRRPTVESGVLSERTVPYDALGRRSRALKPGVYFTREAYGTSKILRVR